MKTKMDRTNIRRLKELFFTNRDLLQWMHLWHPERREMVIAITQDENKDWSKQPFACHIYQGDTGVLDDVRSYNVHRCASFQSAFNQADTFHKRAVKEQGFNGATDWLKDLDDVPPLHLGSFPSFQKLPNSITITKILIDRAITNCNVALSSLADINKK